MIPKRLQSGRRLKSRVVIETQLYLKLLPCISVYPHTVKHRGITVGQKAFGCALLWALSTSGDLL